MKQPTIRLLLLIMGKRFQLVFPLLIYTLIWVVGRYMTRGHLNLNFSSGYFATIWMSISAIYYLNIRGNRYTQLIPLSFAIMMMTVGAVWPGRGEWISLAIKSGGLLLMGIIYAKRYLDKKEKSNFAQIKLGLIILYILMNLLPMSHFLSTSVYAFYAMAERAIIGLMLVVYILDFPTQPEDDILSKEEDLIDQIGKAESPK